MDEAARRREAGLGALPDPSAGSADPELEEVVAGFVSRAPKSRLEPIFEQGVEQEITERSGRMFGAQIRRKEKTVWHLTEVGVGWPAISIPFVIRERTTRLAEVRVLRVLVVTREGRLLLGLREDNGPLVVAGLAPRSVVTQRGAVTQFALGPLRGPAVRRDIMRAMRFRPEEWPEFAGSTPVAGATGGLASGLSNDGSALLPAKLAELFATTLLRWSEEDAGRPTT